MIMEVSNTNNITIESMKEATSNEYLNNLILNSIKLIRNINKRPGLASSSQSEINELLDGLQRSYEIAIVNYFCVRHVTNILNCYFSKQIYTLVHQTKYIPVEN